MKSYTLTRQELLEQREFDKSLVEERYQDQRINMLTYRSLMSAIDVLYHYKLERVDRNRDNKRR